MSAPTKLLTSGVTRLSLSHSIQHTAEFFWLSGLTFPDSEDLPAELPQLFCIPLVSRCIPRSLRLPEFSIRRWHHPTVAALVHVKEAAVDEDCELASRHHDVGFARQVISVQAVADTHLAQELAHHDFGLGVFVPYRSHIAAALLRRVDINH